MLQIYYNGEWVDWKSANIQWNGAIFENGGFSPKQPITEYSVAYKNGTFANPSVSITDSMLVLGQSNGSTGGASKAAKAVYAPNAVLDFDMLKYESITLIGKITHSGKPNYTKWEVGLCNSVPSDVEWDSVSTTTVANITPTASSETSKDFTVTIPVKNITGEKYLCFRDELSFATTSGVSAHLKIDKMILD